MLRHFCQLLLVLICFSAALSAQDPGKEYPDGHGGKVFFPLGDISFADELVSSTPGNPAPKEPFTRERNIVGFPDFETIHQPDYFTLGCHGEVVLRFSDNALLDVEGPDLYVFEVGPDIEPTELAISEDGQTWTSVGEISGGRASVDVAAFTQPGDIFHYVRLRDTGKRCGSRWPGADIDAVGAIGAGRQITLSGSMLFDTAKDELKPEAQQRLREVAAEIESLDGAVVVVEGHTDSVGSEAENQSLSEKRAAAVAAFLKAAGASSVRFETRGYGETRPVGPNESEKGQAKNRRVDLVVTPK